MARTLAPMADRQAGTNPVPQPTTSARIPGAASSACRRRPTIFGASMCWPGAQRDVGVRERESGVALGHEKLARRAAHGIEHAFVEHVPRANLLRDHLGARELGLHENLRQLGCYLFCPNPRARRRLRFVAEPVGTSLIFMVNVEWALDDARIFCRAGMDAPHKTMH